MISLILSSGWKAVARATGFVTESDNFWSNHLSCKEADLL